MNKELYHFEDLAEKFKTLGHPVRLAIIDMLCSSNSGRLKVKTIYEKLNLEQSSVSRHLSIMKKSGILQRTQEANNTFYSLSDHAHVNCITSCFVK